MSVPTLTPASTLSAVVLPVTGATSNVNEALPYKIYSEETSPLYSSEFVSGAVDQVSYVYKKLGGDILDLEITEGNVYAAYEEAVLEYSYLINIHQATNVLSDALGNTTGSFDSKGKEPCPPASLSLISPPEPVAAPLNGSTVVGKLCVSAFKEITESNSFSE